MLTIWGRHQPHCDGVSRRNFLRAGAFGAGLTLADMLRARATGAPTSSSVSPSSSPKAAIMIYLPGGPSHMDMWDLKPNAPKEYAGEFKPIQTNVNGVQICELFPRQAAMWDKLSVIRSIVSVDEHSDSLVMTGYSENQNRNVGHPSFGSVISKLRSGHGGNDVTPFVSLRGMSIGNEPGYLGVAHRAFTPEGAGLRNLRLADGVQVNRMNDRKDLLGKLDSVQREIDATGSMRGMDSFSTRAFDMIASGTVRRALDLTREEPRTRDRYKGLDQFLTARRLVEAGVGCVTLSYGGWDTHGANFRTLRKQLPELDRGIANIVQDLHDRGMDQDVVTVVWGEFGRTPKINNSDGGGRDHWAPVMGGLVAGGGLKMGQAIGASTARGETPKDRRYSVPQVLATIYHAMGIDASMSFPNGSGRPMHILDDRNLVSELV